MFPKTITLTVTSAAEEAAIEQALALTRDLELLAGSAPDGQVLDRCEGAAVAQGRAWTRQALERALDQRLQAAQRKGRRCGAAPAARSANLKVVTPATS